MRCHPTATETWAVRVFGRSRAREAIKPRVKTGLIEKATAAPVRKAKVSDPNHPNLQAIWNFRFKKKARSLIRTMSKVTNGTGEN
jgi:hypothetical protein